MEGKAKIYIGADHAGFALKNELMPAISALGYEIEDLGAESFNAEDDYPDYVVPVAKKVVAEPGSFGIIIGGSGQGEAMAVNRMQGIRAAVFYGGVVAKHEIQAEGTPSVDAFDIVRLPRLHQDANILSLGARFITHEQAVEAARIFLATPFTGDRHARRIAKF